MDQRYVGLEGCEDLWELLRSVNQTKDLLKGWQQHFESVNPGITDIGVQCSNAVDSCEELFGCVKFLYSQAFNALQ